MCGSSREGESALRLLGLPALDHLRPVVELHSEPKSHGREDLFDFLEGLATEVLRLQHVLLAALNELTDERDVRVLEAVRTPHGQLELVDRTEEVLVERLVIGTRK